MPSSFFESCTLWGHGDKTNSFTLKRKMTKSQWQLQQESYKWLKQHKKYLTESIQDGLAWKKSYVITAFLFAHIVKHYRGNKESSFQSHTKFLVPNFLIVALQASKPQQNQLENLIWNSPHFKLWSSLFYTTVKKGVL